MLLITAVMPVMKSSGKVAYPYDPDKEFPPQDADSGMYTLRCMVCHFITWCNHRVDGSVRWQWSSSLDHGCSHIALYCTHRIGLWILPLLWWTVKTGIPLISMF